MFLRREVDIDHRSDGFVHTGVSNYSFVEFLSSGSPYAMAASGLYQGRRMPPGKSFFAHTAKKQVQINPRYKGARGGKDGISGLPS